MIKIRKHLPTDIPYRVKWRNNPNVNIYIGHEIGQKTTLAKEKKWFADYQKDKKKKFFTICDQSTPIGWMGLTNISKVNQNAEIFIAIGEDNYHGKGIGKIALNWIIDYGFSKLNLHKINLSVYEYNPRAIRLYQSLGFINEGDMQDEVFFDGKFHKLLLMALFNSKH